MSWLFSQALVEEFSEANSLDGEQFAPLKKTPTPQVFLWRDKMTGRWNPSRFGMMCEPLMESLGVELLMWFLVGFRAKTYRRQEQFMETQKELRGGERSGLWREMARIVGEVQPRFVFVENSPMLASRGLSRVLSDLSKMGYHAKWGVMGADIFKAPHLRERMWILANSSCERVAGQGEGKRFEKTRPWGSFGSKNLQSMEPFGIHEGCGESPLLRVDDGMAYWMDRIKAIGNGQVPIVASHAWGVLANETD